MLNSLAYFLQKSPDCYHAVATVAALLEDAGFTRLSPGSFSLRGGGTYYLTLGGTSLLAFRVPEGTATGFTITASHSDSP